MFSYIHIPFCEQKCKYCRFASIGNIQKYQVQKYVSFLENEILTIDSKLQQHGVITPKDSILGQKLESLYFGGGTPSVLSPGQISSIITLMKEKFSPTPSIEITLETTPEGVTREAVKGWIGAGVKRISMGVQTLNPESLQEIGRSQKGDIFSALSVLSEAKKNLGGTSDFTISIDMIIGLPYVSKGEVSRDIQLLLESYPEIEHISVYMLEDYYELEDVPTEENPFQKVQYPQPWSHLGIHESEYSEEYISISKLVKNYGFERYEISNFSRNGKSCRHNQAYWQHKEMLGFGLGAHSFLLGNRFSNPVPFSEYYAGVYTDIEKIGEQEQEIERLMFGFRTGGVDMHDFSLQSQSLEQFICEGYIEQSGDHISLTDEGIPLLDYIILALL